jgi:hypothetical protein
LRIYRRQLQKAGFFHIGIEVNIGVESPPGSLLQGDPAEDFVVVPVSFPVFYQDSWTAEPDAEILRSISTKILAVQAQFDGSPLVPGSVDENGIPIEGADGVIVQNWLVS